MMMNFTANRTSPIQCNFIFPYGFSVPNMLKDFSALFCSFFFMSIYITADDA